MKTPLPYGLPKPNPFMPQQSKSSENSPDLIIAELHEDSFSDTTKSPTFASNAASMCDNYSSVPTSKKSYKT